MSRDTKTATGRIAVVQEERFRLITDQHRHLLLTLSHDASVDAADLCRFRDARAHVEVQYSGEPNLSSGVAHNVKPA